MDVLLVMLLELLWGNCGGSDGGVGEVCGDDVSVDGVGVGGGLGVDVGNGVSVGAGTPAKAPPEPGTLD